MKTEKSCKICADERRHDIDRACALSVHHGRLQAVAREFSVSYSSLVRHWRNHLDDEDKDRLRFGDAPASKLKGMVADEGISVLHDLDFARKKILDSLSAAAVDSVGPISMLTGRLHENARLRGQITGELANSKLIINQTNNVAFLQSPMVAKVLDILAKRLQPHPETLSAVIADFRALETEADLSAAPGALPALQHEAAA